MSKLINCAKCGEITQQETINGKKTKNCKRCRDQHTKYKNTLKMEQQPAGGFYKQEQHTIYREQETTEEEEEQATQKETTQEQPAQKETPQEETPQEQTPQEQPTQEEPTQEEAPQEETPQEETPQEEDPKPIKAMLKEIITNIKALTEIIHLQHDETTDILNNLNIKLDNTLNNINKTTTTQPSEADINEFIKKQQIQNKILTNKLDCIIKAIT